MYEEMKIKADILTDALPYIQDFNGNIMVIQYSCNHYVDEAQERVILKDIALLKFLGMKPIIVHSARKGVDLFRENKRIASLIEENQIKAIGICGIDIQTLTMMVANDYIPVVIPNDIATEGEDFFVENVWSFSLSSFSESVGLSTSVSSYGFSIKLFAFCSSDGL